MWIFLHGDKGGGCYAHLDFEKKQATIYTGVWFDRWENAHEGKYITRKLREDSFSYYIKYRGDILRRWKD